jgi:extracellular elastinolytic metalloproteinase
LYWNLVHKHGFAANLFDSKATKEDGLPAGNVIALQLVVDGMKLQPCRPSFVDARDAILQADQVTFEGRNSCEIWKAFAKRGLGTKARSGGTEDFTVPEEC